MDIPKNIVKEIFELKEIREKADKLENSIFEWFENEGIDTAEDIFADDVGSHIVYGEFDTIEDIQKYLDHYFNRRER